MRFSRPRACSPCSGSTAWIRDSWWISDAAAGSGFASSGSRDTPSGISATGAPSRSNADGRNCDEIPRLATHDHRQRSKKSPILRNPARGDCLAFAEEGVDGRFDGRCQRCGHVRRWQLPAGRQRALQRLAGIATLTALCEMGLHRRAHARIDVAFEMLGEEHQDIRTCRPA